MQGIFLDELEKFVVRELGQTGLARMRGLTGRGEGGYGFDASYPDGELSLIVRGIAEATGTHPVDLLEMYGEGMVPGLLEVYGFLVDPRWSFVDFLVNMQRHSQSTEGQQPGSEAARPRGPESGARGGGDLLSIIDPSGVCARSPRASFAAPPRTARFRW